MSKLFKPFALLFILAISFSSCKDKKEDEVVVPVPNTLEGNWKINELNLGQYENGTLIPLGVYSIPNAGTVTLKPDKTGTMVLTIPFAGTQTFAITNWSNTSTTLQIVATDGASINDTLNLDLVVNTKTNQEWFGADPSKTDPNRTESTFKLTPQ